MNAMTWTLNLALAGALIGCSSKPPGCVDTETVATARQMLMDAVTQRLSAFKRLSDDPDRLIPAFMAGVRVEIGAAVSEGYDSDTKRQRCRGNLKALAADGSASEVPIAYATQKTADGQQFVMEIDGLQPLASAVAERAFAHYTANRWTGTWSGTYRCSGVNGATEGPQGPYEQQVSMQVQGTKSRLERTTRGGGTEVLDGDFDATGLVQQLRLHGHGQNSADDQWDAEFGGEGSGTTLRVAGAIMVNGKALRQCEIEMKTASK